MSLRKGKYDLDNEVEPTGSPTPSVYFLLDVPNPPQLRTGCALEPEYKHILSQSAREAGLNEVFKLSTFRFNTCIPYRTIRYNHKERKNYPRSPTNEDLMEFCDDVILDIKNHRPEYIVCCGKNAAKTLGFKKPFDELKGNLDTFQNIPIFFIDSITDTTFASSEAQRRKHQDRFIGELIRFSNFVKGKDINNLEKDLNFTTLDAFDLESVKEVDSIFKDHDKLVLDYETSGLKPYEKNFHLAGIGLCDLNKENSVYIRFYDFERRRTPTNPIPEECLDYINEFFQTKKFVVFNMQYECAVTASSSVGINLNLTEVEDVQMWLRSMSKGSTLKTACMNYLGAKNWSEDVIDWAEIFSNLVKYEKPTPKGKGHRTEIEWLKESGSSIFDLESYFEDQYYLEVLKEFKKLAKETSKVFKENPIDSSVLKTFTEYAVENKKRMNSSKSKEEVLAEVKELVLEQGFTFNKGKEFFLKKKDIVVLECLKDLRTLCQKYFPEEGKFRETSFLLKDYLIRLLDNHKIFVGTAYSEIPIEIVAPYCMLDCNYTAELYHVIKSKLEERGLEESCKFYERQAYMGYIFSKNGIAWNDDLASTLDKEYSKAQLETLRSLILLPKIKDTLNLSPQDVLQIKSTTVIDELKEFFNPMSNHKYETTDPTKATSYRMSKAIFTPRFKVASMFYECYEASKQMKNPEDAVRHFPIIYPLYKEIITLETTSDRLEFLENILRTSKQFQEDLLFHRDRMRKDKISQPEKEVELYKKYIKYDLESMDQEATEYMYRTFKEVIKINPDDDSEWPEEFAALYYFKIFKKIDKSQGTYISGSVGRQSVELVKKDEIESFCPKRVGQYFTSQKKDDEIYIVNTDWNVCGAKTGRWSSSQHTVPKKTELMDLRTTRYYDGIKVHYDFSQAEVRVLAAMANDDRLLKAFISGLDVHRYNASLMWEKSMEDVSDAERGVAKGVTFSILYGSSIAEFANKYTKGNIKEAENIINSFFDQYPNVRKFINEMHIQGATHGWVPNLFNNPLFVDSPLWFSLLHKEEQMALIANPYDYNVVIGAFGRDDEKKERSKLATCLRYSQNYCIQSSSSILSALSMYELQKDIERNNMSVKLECFTHDSCDADTRIKDLLPFLNMLPKACINYINDEFEVPMKIDYEIGVSNNKMIELEDAKIEGNIIRSKFGGTERSLIELEDQLKKHGVNVQYDIQKEQEKILSIEQLFLTKSAYAIDLGKKYVKMSGELTLEFEV